MVAAFVANGLGKALMLSSSNFAVAAFLEALAKRDTRFLRVLSRSRERMDYMESVFSIHRWVADKTVAPEWAKKIMASNQGSSTLTLESLLLSAADVVASTLITAFDPRLLEKQFDLVVIDESSQISISNLIPSVKSCDKIVFAGDDRQLAPVIMDSGLHSSDLSFSYLDLLSKFGAPYALLTENHRLPHELSRFVSSTFYDGELRNGKERAPKFKDVDSIYLRNPIIMLVDRGVAERANGNKSFFCRTEADATMKVVEHLMALGVKSTQITLLTGNNYYNFVLSVIIKCSWSY